MEKIIHDEKNGLNYELVGDYYLPCLKALESPKVGRFGLVYLDYLRNHKKIEYSGLMMSDKLKEHIESIDRQAEEMLFQLVRRMAKAEGVTEQLKAADQMCWIGKMESIQARATEIVNHQLIYN